MATIHEFIKETTKYRNGTRVSRFYIISIHQIKSSKSAISQMQTCSISKLMPTSVDPAEAMDPDAEFDDTIAEGVREGMLPQHDKRTNRVHNGGGKWVGTMKQFKGRLSVYCREHGCRPGLTADTAPDSEVLAWFGDALAYGAGPPGHAGHMKAWNDILQLHSTKR